MKGLITISDAIKIAVLSVLSLVSFSNAILNKEGISFTVFYVLIGVVAWYFFFNIIRQQR